MPTPFRPLVTKHKIAGAKITVNASFSCFFLYKNSKIINKQFLLITILTEMQKKVLRASFFIRNRFLFIKYKLAW